MLLSPKRMIVNQKFSILFLFLCVSFQKLAQSFNVANNHNRRVRTNTCPLFVKQNENALGEPESLSTVTNVDVSEDKEEKILMSPGMIATNMTFPKRNGYTMPTGKKIGYSAFLENEPKWLRKLRGETSDDFELDEDGYGDIQRRRSSSFKRAIKFPLKFASRVFSKKPVEPGTLILVRHGESEWNKNKTFTGWADPDLTEQGRREVEHAARLLMAGGYKIDVVFTSRLKRAIRSVWILLQELNEVYLPVFKSWRLNERMYGALTGLSKTETAEKLGKELVQEWRGSLRSRPPALKPKDTYWPGRERRYADLTDNEIPLTESLLDCMERTFPLWEKKIKYELGKGRNVMVVAHANTLRGLVKTIDNIGDAEIQDVAIPTGIPIIYKFDQQLNAIPPKQEDHAVSQIHMNALFLEKPGILKEALKFEKEWRKAVPGYDETMSRHKRPMTYFERSLYKLNATRELGEYASGYAREYFDENAPLEDDGNDGNYGRPMVLSESEVWDEGIKELEKGDQFDPDGPLFHESERETNLMEENTAFAELSPSIYTPPCVTSIPSAAVFGNNDGTPVRRDSVIVIIRHGKTQHNKLGLFTGWVRR